MSTNHTSNYRLCQWERSDKVLMEDFNADNAKIDAALAGKAEGSALEALAGTVTGKADASALSALSQTVSGHAAALAGKGNCQIWTTTYVGNGYTGADYPNRVAFPKLPAVVLIASPTGVMSIFMPGQTAGISIGGSSPVLTVKWVGNTLTWSNHQNSGAQLNIKDTVYHVVALMTA
mgnify:CR=1 FL=1